MLILTWSEGKPVYRAEAETDGSAEGGAPAGEEAGSEESNDFENLFDGEEFEGKSQSTAEDKGAAESDEGSDDDGRSDADDDASADEKDDDADDDAGDDSEGKDEDQGEEEDADAGEEITPEKLTEMRNQYIEKVAQNYALSEEDADELRTEPEKALPRILARVHTETVEMMTQMMRDNLPVMVSNQLRLQESGQKVESEFFGRFEELNTKEGRKAVEQMAKAYRQANPKASREEAIENVGLMAWRKMGLPMDKLANKLGWQGAAEERFEKSGKERTKKDAFSPERPGKTGNPGKQTDEQATIWDELNKAIDLG